MWIVGVVLVLVGVIVVYLAGENRGYGRGYRAGWYQATVERHTQEWGATGSATYKMFRFAAGLEPYSIGDVTGVRVNEARAWGDPGDEQGD